MLTIEKLREYGANVEEGLGRCMNNEAFYLRLTGMVLKDDPVGKLSKALAEDNKTEAFEAAHALKGVTANLSLTPLYEPVSEITEYLRAKTEMDYTPLLAKITEEAERLRKLIEEQ